MSKRIVIVQGNPDAHNRHFCHALATAYLDGAGKGHHAVREVDIGAMNFPLLRDKTDWEQGAPPDVIREAQEAIAWAEHLVIIYPLWLGDMPALLKAFLEQVMRPGFAVGNTSKGGMTERLLSGKSARLVVTMGMPAYVYRWYFGAHGVKVLTRHVLKICGVAPVATSLIGMVEESALRRERWLQDMRLLGERAD